MVFTIAFLAVLLVDAVPASGAGAVIAADLQQQRRFSHVATGNGHTVWRDNDGTVWAVGNNSDGQLGNGTTTWSATPVQVMLTSTQPLENVVAVGAGFNFSAALTSSGDVYTWGDDTWGQLGDGNTRADSPWPVRVRSDSGGTTYHSACRQLAVGGKNAACIQHAGRLYAWGDNVAGQLGRGTVGGTVGYAQYVYSSGTTPIDRVAAVAVSDGGSWILMARVINNGTAWSVGSDYGGRLGNGTATNEMNVAYPVQVEWDSGGAVTAVVGVAAAAYSGAVVRSSGEVATWGNNTEGQLGDGTMTSRSGAVYAKRNSTTNLDQILAVSAGFNHFVALRATGTAYTWGMNARGQLAHGTTTDSVWATIAKRDGGTNLVDLTAVTAGSDSTLFLRADDLLFGAGSNSYGELATTYVGNPALAVVADHRQPLRRYLHAVSAGDTTYLLRSDGTVWAAGRDTDGQLGDGVIGPDTNSFSQVMTGAGAPLTFVTWIDAYWNSAVARRANGGAFAWGWNGGSAAGYGKLGIDSTAANTAWAVQVRHPGTGTVVGIRDISVGIRHVATIANGGSVWISGQNTCAYDGTTQSYGFMHAGLTFGQGVTDVTDVAAGGFHTATRRASGQVRVCGYNSNGQVGVGNTTYKQYFDQAIVCDVADCGSWATMPKDYIGVAAGDYHSAALEFDGNAGAWGLNTNGQVGDRTLTERWGVRAVRRYSDSVSIGGGTKLDGGGHHSILGHVRGDSSTWGRNLTGSLALGHTSVRDGTEPTIDAAGVSQHANSVNGGYNTSQVTRADGTVWWAGGDTLLSSGRCHSTATAVTVFTRLRCTPATPTSHAIYEDDGTTVVAAGTWTRLATGSDPTIRVRATITDGDVQDWKRPYVELQPWSTAFSGTCGVRSATVFEGTRSEIVYSTSANQTIGVTLRLPPGSVVDGQQYRVRLCAVDDNGLASGWTPAAASWEFGVDRTVPSSPAVIDGSAAPDVDWQGSTTSLAASWTTATDASSGVAAYEYCFSTATGCSGTVVVNWTSASLSTSATATSLSLVGGTTYFACVRVRDAAGNVTNPSCSDGVTIVAVTGASPSSLPQGIKGATVQVTGAGFASGITVAMSGSGVTVTGATYVSTTRIDVVVDVAGAAALGSRDIVVTSPDATTATGTGLVTITAPSLSVALSTLGYSDAVRDSASPYALGFGTLFPSEVREIGSTASGQTTAGAAVEATLVSDTTAILQASGTDFSDGAAATVPIGQLAYRTHGTANAWTSFTTTDTTIASSIAPGTTALSWDYRMAVPAAQPPGSYSGSVTYTLLAAP